MDEAAVAQHIAETFPGVQVDAAEGVTVFSYNPARRAGAGVYFASLKSKDDDRDDVSQLHRAGVYRLNVGLSEPAYRALFGPAPPRPGDDDLIETTHDFTALDQLMPHPVYAYMAWACVLCPGDATFDAVKPLLADAYALAVSHYVDAPAGA
jgi:hypothetical protein